MKKILMTIAAAFVATTMSAQIYVGGSLGLGFENKLVDTTDGSEATGMTFQIKPEIGYTLDENSALGIVIGFGTTNNGNFQYEGTAMDPGNKMEESAMTFSLAPYYRYNFLKVSNVSVFVDGQFNFDYTKQDEWNNTKMGLGLVPGVAVNLNDKFSVVAKMGFIGWQQSKDKDKDAKSTFGLDVNSLGGLQFGLYYNL